MLACKGLWLFLPVKWEPRKVLSREGTALTLVFTGIVPRLQELYSQGRGDRLEARKPERR